MQRLVKFICSMLLLFISQTWMDKQDESALQEAMTPAHQICTISTECPVAEKTIAHLYAEQIAVPIVTTGELPGYHFHHSKPKCLHTNTQNNRYATFLNNLHSVHPSPSPHHVIDYYIYTLGHILI